MLVAATDRDNGFDSLNVNDEPFASNSCALPGVPYFTLGDCLPVSGALSSMSLYVATSAACVDPNVDD
jgi:hypothetical protein